LFVAGNLQDAAAQASAGVTRFDRKRDSSWYWDLRFLYAEILGSQADRKGVLSLLHEPVPSRAGLDQAEVRRLIDLAIWGAQSEQERAALLAKAGAMAKDPELLVRLDRTQGGILNSRGKYGEAQRLYQAALERATRFGIRYQEAYVLNDLSISAKSQNRYEDAIALGQRAVTVADGIGARRVAAFAHGNLGSAYALLGNFDAALEQEQAAIQVFEKIGARSNLMVALGELGLLYDRQDDSAKALENYRKAYNLACELGSVRDQARTAGNLALTMIKSRQWDAAEEWNERSAVLVKKAHYDDFAPLVERNRARIAWGRNHPAEAARICGELLKSHPDNPAVRWEAYELLGEMEAAVKHYGSADRSFEAALGIISDSRKSLTESRNRITLLSRLMPFYQVYVSTLVAQNDDARALRVIESSRARVLSERLGRDLQSDRFPNAAAFESAAAANHAAILTFWVAPQRSFAWLITPARVERFELPPAAEIEKLVTAYRETVEHSLRDPIAVNDPAGPALWHALLEKIAPHIPKNTPLIVIPDGPLHRLNLETLIVPAPEPHYWIDDVQIAVSPSITIAGLRAATAAPSKPALLLIGNPNYAGTSYDPLPDAAAEIHDVKAHFPNAPQQVYLGAQATPAAYRQTDPAQFSLIHFAAHAEANYERPLESTIILSPNGGHQRLYARDVADIPIHAALVTISACRSAGTRAYAGEGLMGFAWAFLNAGARAVIAGLWDVSDVSTSQLMDRLYAGVASGGSPAAALRAAKLTLLHGDPKFRKPFYWAPFQVYLGSGAR
jgi:CHAT domain-containing protein